MAAFPVPINNNLNKATNQLPIAGVEPIGPLGGVTVDGSSITVDPVTGVISSTAGGGNLSGSLTTGYIPKALTTDSLGDSPLDVGITEEGWISSNFPLNIIVSENPTADPGDVIEALYYELDVDLDGQPSTSVPIIGFDCEVYLIGDTIPPDSIMGMYCTVDSTGEVNVPRIDVVQLEPAYSGSGTVDELNALHILGKQTGGVVTALTGLRIAGYGAGTAIKTDTGLVDLGDTLSLNGLQTNKLIYSLAGTPIPSASTAGIGARAFVSDASSSTFGAPYLGSGSNHVPVFSTGSAWLIG
jgi:hypothetical protein